MPSITSVYPGVPSDFTVAPRRPTRGATMSGLAEGACHLHGFRFLRDFHVPCSTSLDPLLITDKPGYPSIQTPIRHVWRVSPYATYLYLGYWHVAREVVKGATSQIVTNLYTWPVPGAAVTTWTLLADRLKVLEDGETGISSGKEGYVCTDWTSELLDVSALRGTDVELRAALAGVRVYGVDVIEVYEGEVS